MLQLAHANIFGSFWLFLIWEQLCSCYFNFAHFNITCLSYILLMCYVTSIVLTWMKFLLIVNLTTIYLVCYPFWLMIGYPDQIYEKLSSYLKMWNKPRFMILEKWFFTLLTRLKKWRSDAKYRFIRWNSYVPNFRSCVMCQELREIIPCVPHIRHCQVKHKINY